MQLENKLFGVDILQEFESLPRVKPNADFTTAQKSDNIPRNRYKDIVPYEENRVRITPSKENKSGYINASHITVSNRLLSLFVLSLSLSVWVHACVRARILCVCSFSFKCCCVVV